MVNAQGKIEGQPVIVGVQDFAFMGGSMGTAVGAAFVAGAQEAIKRRCPYIMFTAAAERACRKAYEPDADAARDRRDPAAARGGPALCRGADRSDDRRRDGELCDAGRRADRRAKALIAFAGARVIQDTIREKLPEGFQRSEFLLDHGMLDMVVHRKELRAMLAKTIDYLTAKAA